MFYSEKGILSSLNYRIALEANIEHSNTTKKHLLAAAYDFSVPLGNCRQTKVALASGHVQGTRYCITADFSASCAVATQIMQRLLLYREELQLHRVGLDVLMPRV